MSLTGSRRFVGIGFGPIQAGLFLYEASAAGTYAPPTIVDVRPDLVDDLRWNDGRFHLNIAGRLGIACVEIGPIRTENSAVPEDRDRIVAALAQADEAATALPSVETYRSAGPGSPHALFAEALRRRCRPAPLAVYCAENHRRAAAILEEAVLEAAEPRDRDAVRGRARFADTVIGKMSGVVTEPSEIASLGLTPMTPRSSSAFLVEEFNHIQVSALWSDAGRASQLLPGIAALEPVEDLEPFAAAKLLGHNATHALAAYLARLLGLRLIADLGGVPGAIPFLRAAFIDESGAGLMRRHRGAGALFTPAGFTDFADDLLERMTNPLLADTVDRAARDPRRKAGWDDRLVGVLRLGLATGVPTPSYAMGTAAALVDLDPSVMSVGRAEVRALLRSIWPPSLEAAEADAVASLVVEGLDGLRRWRDSGFRFPAHR